MIVYYNAPDEVKNHAEELKIWLHTIANNKNFAIAELAFSFLDDKEIRKKNREFLNHDYPTDIITFDYTEGSKIKAEILIGLETVRNNSLTWEVPFSNELDRVLVHGLLHCMGYQDKDPESREIMRAEENKSLILRPKNLINR